MKVSRWLTTLAVVACFASTNAAEPTPQERQWDAAVARLVEVISKQADIHSMSDMIAANASIAPFEFNRTESFNLLPDRLPAGRLVSVHSYIHPSVSCASDIVADLSSSGTIDTEIMHKLAPNNEADLRKADATVARWFETALEVKSGDPVAIMVLYDDGKAEPAHAPQLSFVLIRGEEPSTGQVRFVRALYGPMQSALK